MVTFAQLRDLDTSNLNKAASSAGSLSEDLSTRGSEVSAAAKIPVETWSGSDSTAASAKLSPLSEPLYDTSDSSSRAKGVLEDLAVALQSEKERLQDAYDVIAGTGITISDDGTVHTPPVDSEEEAQRNAELARKSRGIIVEALAGADRADNDAASALDKLGDAFGDGLGEFSNVVSSAAEVYGDIPEEWRRAGRNAGRFSTVLSGVLAGGDQLLEDWNDPELDGGDMALRAGYRGVVEGAGGYFGAGAGLKGGTIAGAAFGHPGAVAGGFLGAFGGGFLGATAADWLVDRTIDPVTDAGREVRDFVGGTVDEVQEFADDPVGYVSDLSPF